MLARLLNFITWPMLFLCLAGTGMSVRGKLFIGWFGPRGLASIVFAVIIFDAGAPGRETLAVAAALTVLLSVMAHGASANPLIARLVAPAVDNDDETHR